MEIVQERLDRNEEVDDRNMKVMTDLVAAMSRGENGVPAVPREVLAGWNLYLG